DAALDLDRLWEFKLLLPPIKYPSGDAQRRFFAALEERIASEPRLQSAALAGGSPFNGRDSRGIVMDDERIPDGSLIPQAAVVAIGPRYFETLGLRVTRGSRLEDVDAASRDAVALVNERFAARFSPGVDPIGRNVVLINERVPTAPPQ